MIHWIEIENYLSFAEPVRIELTPGKVVDDYSVFEAPSGTRLNKFVSIVGANASGKTNILKALVAVATFVVHSFKKDDKDATNFFPHFFYPDKQARIAIQFEIVADEQPESDTHNEAKIRSRVFRYEVSATKSHVIYEKLSERKSRTFTRVYERVLDVEEYEFKGIAKRYSANMPRNASMISWLARQKLDKAQTVQNFFASISAHSSMTMGRMPAFFSAITAIDIYRHTPSIKSRMVSMLKEWDLGIEDIELVQRALVDSEGQEHSFWDADVTHIASDRTAKLGLHDESSGTVEFFCHIGPILQVLAKGGVMVIDEIEDGLHPDLVEALLELFIRPETNPKNAQLIFTTHSHWIMDYLNKWQIVLVEKRDCVSRAWRVSSMSGVENRDVLSKKYRAGALGAIPRHQPQD